MSPELDCDWSLQNQHSWFSEFHSNNNKITVEQNHT